MNRWNAGHLVKTGQTWDDEQATARGDTACWRASAEAVINGTPGDDTLVGTSGADTIDGGAGADEMRGLKGSDTYLVDNVGDRVIEAAGGGNDTVRASVGFTLADNVENLVLTGNAGLSGTGNALDNKLTGNAGNNWLDGKEGADTMVGGKGDDTYRVDNAGDVVAEKAGQGIDTVSTSIDYTLGQGVENLTMWSTDTGGIKGHGNELANSMSDWIGSDLLAGLDGNDTLNGGTVLSPGASDTLDGGNGDDVLNAGRYSYSSDVLYGGEGSDTLTVKAGANALYGGGGDDLLLSGSGGMYHGPSDYLDGGAGNDTLQGGGSLSGGDGDDLVTTNAFTGYATGGQGNDTDRLHQRQRPPGHQPGHAGGGQRRPDGRRRGDRRRPRRLRQQRRAGDRCRRHPRWRHAGARRGRDRQREPGLRGRADGAVHGRRRRQLDRAVLHLVGQ